MHRTFSLPNFSLGLVTLLTLASGCTTCTDASSGSGPEAGVQATTTTPTFEEVPCAGFPPVVSLKVDASTMGETRCGFMKMPENRSKPNGRTVRLPVFVAKAKKALPDAPPLVMLNGGPGGASVSFLGGFATTSAGEGQLEPLRQDRDVVLVNERGVEFSEPELGCSELDALGKAVFGDDRKIHETTIEKRLAAVDACFKRWTTAGVDLASFNIHEMSSDVHDAMKALGYKSFDVYGVSFGSMFAQQIAKRFPDEVKALVLDSPVALDGNLIVDVVGAGGSADKALETLFSSCAADASCNAAHPNLRDSLVKVAADLNANPAPYGVVDPTDPSKPPFAWQLTGDLLVGTMVANMAPGAIGTFPAMIDGLKPGPAREVVLKRLGDVASATLMPSTDKSHAMRLSVVCSGWGFANPASLTDGGNPLLTKLTELGRNQLAECGKWPVPKMQDSWKEVNQPLVSKTIPALILPAKFDANTPPETAKRIAGRLEHAFVHEAPDRGHAMLDFKCAGPVIRSFLADTSRDPDASCIESAKVQWQ